MGIEYCWQNSNYFATNLSDGAESFRENQHELSQCIADLLQSVEWVVLCHGDYIEKGYGLDQALGYLIRDMPKIEKAVARLKHYQRPFASLVNNAVKDAINKAIEPENAPISLDDIFKENDDIPF